MERNSLPELHGSVRSAGVDELVGVMPSSNVAEFSSSTAAYPATVVRGYRQAAAGCSERRDVDGNQGFE
jgi:hypothetical protein